MQEKEHTHPVGVTCPSGHQSVIQRTDGTFYCMDCGWTS